MVIEINVKRSAIDKRVFRFEGEPIPPQQYVAMDPHLSADTSRTMSGVSREPEAKDLVGTKVSLMQENSFVQNFKDSIVASGRALGQIHIQNGVSSLIDCISNGPIFIENVCNLVIVIECHQLRLRGLEKCKIYGRIGNNTIVIEECTDLEFGTIESEASPKQELIVDDFSDPSNRGTSAPSSSQSALKNISFVDSISTDELKLARDIPVGPIGGNSVFSEILAA